MKVVCVVYANDCKGSNKQSSSQELDDGRTNREIEGLHGEESG